MQIDLEHWSLSMLNKRASAWEQQERRAARKRLKQQTEAAEAGDDGGTAAGVGTDVTAAGSGIQRSGAAAGGGSRPGGGTGGGASFAPQVRIGDDGAVVLDVQSLTVQAQEQDIENFTRVDEQVSDWQKRGRVLCAAPSSFLGCLTACPGLVLV